MAPRMRAEVRVTHPARCPLVDVAGDASIRSVSRADVRDDPQFVAEFVADGSVDGAEKVFDYGSEAVYRVDGASGGSCVCDRIERMGYPVRDHRVENGTVTLAFFVPDIAALRSVVTAVAADGFDVSIRRLTRSESDAEEALVYVDKGELTDRQLEVLRTAQAMGYFEHPKAANAGEVADALGISTSTFTEHLSAAQRKLLGAVLG